MSEPATKSRTSSRQGQARAPKGASASAGGARNLAHSCGSAVQGGRTEGPVCKRLRAADTEPHRRTRRGRRPHERRRRRTVSAIRPASGDHVRRGNLIRHRRQRPAATAAARLPADACDVAPDRATRWPSDFTVVCATCAATAIRPSPTAASAASIIRSAPWRPTRSKLMRAQGFAHFRLVGHDRGARVAHRLCLDHPDAVERVAVLDISPTRIMYGRPTRRSRPRTTIGSS